MTYEDKIEAKRQRYAERAKKARAEAEARHKASNEAVAGIPFGQPILVGHHSERRHRAALKRSHANMQKALEADRKAKHYEHKAATAGQYGISADDERAAEKLRVRISAITANVDEMKAVNAAWRKHGRPEGSAPDEAWQPIREALAHLHIDWHHLRAEMNRNFMNRPGKPRPPYESWMLSNATANRRRLEARLADIERQAQARAEHGDEPEELYAGDGWRIVANHAENRVQVFFPGKPDHETRQTCKRQGFRWAPSAGAWQRQLNNAGRYAASAVADFLRKGAGDDQ